MKQTYSRKACITFVAALGVICSPLVSTVASASAAPSVPAAFQTQLQNHQYTLYYDALGDSVAAGYGLPHASDASAEDSACGRSPQAYANIVGSRLNTLLNKVGAQLTTNNVSCAGATATNFTKPQMVGNTTVKPQLEKTFAPALVTITIGANDSHWAQFIASCFAASNCDTPANTATINTYLTSLKSNLADTMVNLTARNYGMTPRVVVTGYYNPLSQQCANTTLTTSEINWVKQETEALNGALRQATQNYKFANFAPVDFTGHDICSADSWIQRPGVDPEPFHPTAKGQEVMADAVLQHIL